MPERKSLRQTLILQDFSDIMKDRDLSPNKAVCVMELILKFTENNPLSEFSYGLLRNQKCEILKLFSDSQVFINRKLKKLIKELSYDDFNLHSTLKMDSVKETEPLGEISLYEALQKGKQIFQLSQLFFNKEIYLILASPNSIDTGPIYDILHWYQSHNIKISIINLSSSSFLYQNMCKLTGGKMVFPQNRDELEDFIYDIAEPLFLENDKVFKTKIQVSFPCLTPIKAPIICMCHGQFIQKGFKCSQCGVLNCSMSSSCILCGIKLIAASEIVRTTVGLHLEGKFIKVKGSKDICYSCQLDDLLDNQCQNCQKNFCSICCELIKTDLRFCLGCFENQLITGQINLKD